jgi:hypothetical protein
MSKEREMLVRVYRFLKSDAEDDFGLGSDIREILSQPEQTEQEPVAWRYERQNGDFTERTLSAGFEKNFDGVCIPLYTAPTKREPLSDDVIWVGMKDEPPISCSGFIRGVKFSEKHHKIGETK